MSTLEEVYRLQKRDVELERTTTQSGRALELFDSPGRQEFIVEVRFPEFTCLCPKTSQPDFAEILIRYVPRNKCVELKSLKYYLNSFRNEGHFHEAVVNLIYEDLYGVLEPVKLYVEGRFNVRGGTYPVIKIGEEVEGKKKVEKGTLGW